MFWLKMCLMHQSSLSPSSILSQIFFLLLLPPRSLPSVHSAPTPLLSSQNLFASLFLSFRLNRLCK